jgi:NAD(P)-dependent dehydrogenase (short-subunit alcohol dehydrogenase family)
MRASPSVVVTGATSGIGLALAEVLAPVCGELVLVGRDPARLQTAVAKVQARAAPGLRLVPIQADLAKLADNRALAERVLAELPRLDVLVHNAGVWPSKRALTCDGFEAAFATNHLSPFLLNRLLRERLLSSGARVVQVTAGLYIKGKVDLDADPTGARFGRFSAYPATKLWNLLATLELARGLRGQGVTVNAVHPGVVNTRLGDAPGLLGLVLKRVKRSWLSPEDGAKGPLHLCTSPELEGVTGTYFDQLRAQPLHPVALTPGLGARVVERTEKLLERA